MFKKSQIVKNDSTTSNLVLYCSDTPGVDTIFKERNRLKQKQIDIQNNIKKTIDNTDTQIRKLRNKIVVLENKNKRLIVEYNKECERKEDIIRGATPPKIAINKVVPYPNVPVSPKSRIIQSNSENGALIKMVESLARDLKIQERQVDTKMEKIETEQNSRICNIL
jgi:hypothetical protein